MDLKVGKRSQVVIPAAIRHRLGIRDGDTLRADVDERGRLILERVPSDPIARMRRVGGEIYAGSDGVDEQRALRDEWER